MTERPTIAARLLGSVHPAQEGHRVTNFELLFDLVFVFEV